jgi:5-methyltetrahydrofolate--homocysteine methyltransferase
MRAALEDRPAGPRPTLEQITEALGPFSSDIDGTGEDAPEPRRNRRRRA